MRFEYEAHFHDRDRRDFSRKERFDAFIGSKTIDALPRGDAQCWHESLLFQRAVRKQVDIAGGEEIGLAFETVLLVYFDDIETVGFEQLLVVRLLTGAGGEQVRKSEDL